MSWVRLDDGFRDHPKILAAGPLASWVHVCALCYCSEHGTDGFVPIAVLSRLADVTGVGKHAEKLVKVGLWERADGGFQIHDYLEWQPSADQVKERRKANNDRIAKWREKNQPKREGNAVGNAVTETHSNKVRNADVAVPVTPPPSSSSSSSTIRERAPAHEGVKTAMDPTWTLDAALRGIAAECAIQNVDQVFTDFKLYQQKEGKLSADWVAAWRYWCGRQRSFQQRERRGAPPDPPKPASHQAWSGRHE